MTKPLWRAYRLSFRLLSPLHLGWRTIGNLQQTRSYVTGRVLWGALTARLTRDTYTHPSAADYLAMGRQVDEVLAFSYFYPSTEMKEVSCWPWRESRDEFAWTFIGSYASTALDPERVATVSSLHETECISPHARKDRLTATDRTVYLVGYVFAREDCVLDWQSAFIMLVIGGERSYGWGRITLADKPERIHDGEACFEHFKVNLRNIRPALTAQTDTKLLAHALCRDSATSQLIPKTSEVTSGQTTASDATQGMIQAHHGDTKGDRDVEPFLGRETSALTTKNGGEIPQFGAKRSAHAVCWTPGSACRSSERFYIGYRGIWDTKLTQVEGSAATPYQPVPKSPSRRAEKRRETGRSGNKKRKR